jgi:hypothetical protein
VLSVVPLIPAHLMSVTVRADGAGAARRGRSPPIGPFDLSPPLMAVQVDGWTMIEDICVPSVRTERREWWCQSNFARFCAERLAIDLISHPPLKFSLSSEAMDNRMEGFYLPS